MVDLALKTLLHDKLRFFITVAGVAFAVTLILVQVGLFLGLRSFVGRNLLLSLVNGYWLSHHTSAAWPYVDSFMTWASVITTWMVARKILENWIYWMVIDSLSIPLYINRGLYLTAILFVGYVIIVVFGYLGWRRHYLAGNAVAAANA